MATKCKSSLLYGEFTPRGLNKALDEEHLKAHQSCRIMYDMGMGVGKAAMQAFLQCTNMEKVVGIELTTGRYSVAADAALQLCKQHPFYFSVRHYNPGIRCVIAATEEYEILLQSLSSSLSSSSSVPVESSIKRAHPRVYEVRCQDMFTCGNELEDVDVLLLMTDIIRDKRKECMKMLYMLPIGARVLTYDDFPELMEKPSKNLGRGWGFPGGLNGFSMSSWRGLGRFLSLRQNKQRLSNGRTSSSSSSSSSSTTAESREALMMNTPFLQVHVNKSVCDRFSATWSLNRGHHLFIYQRSQSQATITSDVVERLRQSTNNADILYDYDNNKTDKITFNDLSRDNEGDEKNESESDISCKDESLSSSSSSSLSTTLRSDNGNNYKKNKRNNKSFVAVRKRVQHAESMFVSLFRLFPGYLLSSKGSPGSGSDEN
tara:strand:+ start:1448 stop:2740 length:1293 start_codon:yes stop_codon:yes gene_type:complete